MTSLLTINDLRVTFPGHDAVRGLNLTLNAGETLALVVHGMGSRAERQRAVRDILYKVGLPQRSLERYPHEFSGGQRQRIGIARALVIKPSLVICDEPVSALDVSIQAQILNLLVELKNEMGLALLFISHDFAVVRYIADNVMVMHNGNYVEQGDSYRIWHQPQHPYTRKLIDAVPSATLRTAQEIPASTTPTVPT